MEAHDIQKWIRCNQLARLLKIEIIAKDTFHLGDGNGNVLGILATVDEVFAYLCGYEVGHRLGKLAGPEEEGEE